MSIITAMDNQYARLVYHADKKIVHHCFHQALDSHHLRLVLSTGVEFLQKYQAKKWLSDNREIEPHSDEDTEWVNNNWLPNALNAGWKYWALVVPDSVKSKMNMVDFINSFYDHDVRIMVFVDTESAMEWLEHVDSRHEVHS